MDIQLRKINFVQEFLKLNDEKTIDRLEKVLQDEKSKIHSGSIKPISADELNGMIDKAEDDSKNNKVKEARKLKNELDSWT